MKVIMTIILDMMICTTVEVAALVTSMDTTVIIIERIFSVFPNNKYSSRQQIGQRAGYIGVAANIVLFSAKCTIGLIGNSVSILADAFNNLTDCAASVVAIIGFKLCGKEADDKYPNGYGRMEYISGFIVSFLIMTTALSFGKYSIARILTPQITIMPSWFLWIPVASIIIKLALVLYTHMVNRVIQSATLRTMFKDNVSDAILTAMTLISLLLAPFTTLPLDGAAGLLIAAAIMWSGITSFQENLSLLLGKGTDKELIEQIVELVLKQDNVFSGVESIATYDFGPEKRLAFIQVCLKASPHLENVQIAIQKLTGDLKQTLNLEATIYWNASHHEKQKGSDLDASGETQHFKGELSKNNIKH